jgi:CheY-like chemotaxis protein
MPLGGATDFEHTYRLLLPDGRVKHVHALAHALQEASGNREFVGAVTDITERKTAEEALRTSEAYLAEAQRLSHTGSWAWSLDTDVRHWSEECYRILGFDPRDGSPRMEELIQRVHPDDQPAFRESINRAWDLLESAGFSAAVFARAASLLKSRRLSQVSCLIADMRMPKMTGLELHQHLLASNRAIPTILMTAYPDARMQAQAQAIKANVVCYLIKPFAADELLACVRCALQGHDVGGGVAPIRPDTPRAENCG